MYSGNHPPSPCDSGFSVSDPENGSEDARLRANGLHYKVLLVMLIIIYNIYLYLFIKNKN